MKSEFITLQQATQLLHEAAPSDSSSTKATSASVSVKIAFERLGSNNTTLIVAARACASFDEASSPMLDLLVRLAYIGYEGTKLTIFVDPCSDRLAYTLLGDRYARTYALSLLLPLHIVSF